MLIYRFRIVSEEHEDFSMEIEIQPGQTFRDFHECIIESVELPPPDKASFYLTDKKYLKGAELSLKSYKKQVKKYDKELDEMVMETITPRLMKDSKIKNYIEDPHQRMIYEYTGKYSYIFFIELFRIIQSDGMLIYPRCSRKSGELPKKTPPPVFVEPPKPAAPKIELPKTIVPPAEMKPKFEDIVENEEELALIEQQIGDLLMDEAPVELEPEITDKPEEQDAELSMFEGEPEEEMEHLEDYDDIEQIEMKYTRLEDPDDN